MFSLLPHYFISDNICHHMGFPREQYLLAPDFMGCPQLHFMAYSVLVPNPTRNPLCACVFLGSQG